MLPSLEIHYSPGQPANPNIVILEVKPRQKTEYDQDKTLGWIVVERQEVYRRNPETGEVVEGSINLFFCQVDAEGLVITQERGCWSGGYSREHNRVSLTHSSATSKGGVFFDLPGMKGNRVGTYLMNEIIRWAQQWPEACVNSITLDASQGYPENKQRRNRFYEQFGLEFDYADANQKSGTSRPIKVGQLNTVDSWQENITVHQVIPFLRTMFRKERDAALELDCRQSAIKRLVKEQREVMEHPIRWAMRHLWYRHRVTAAITSILLISVVSVWLRTTGSTL